jgi:hypothetical protein
LKAFFVALLSFLPFALRLAVEIWRDPTKGASRTQSFLLFLKALPQA